MYLFGGGNALPVYMRTEGQTRSAVFCKEVTAISRPLGNTQRKTWTLHNGKEQLVRVKTLASSWFEAYSKLGGKVIKIQPTDKLTELMEYMGEHHQNI